MNNLDIYNKVRKVPPEALKKISGGRLNNMSDINPMWRLKMLTELFGVCGFGWKYVITSQRLEKGAKDEVSAFVDIDLFVKMDDVWSDAIPGIGGSSFISQESKGMYNSDECFKMALTDAIGISCKALGIGADVWFDRDVTKYTQPTVSKTSTVQKSIDADLVTRLYEVAKNHGITPEQVMKGVMSYGKTSIEALSETQYAELITRIAAPKQPKT